MLHPSECEASNKISMLLRNSFRCAIQTSTILSGTRFILWSGEHGFATLSRCLQRKK